MTVGSGRRVRRRGEQAAVCGHRSAGRVPGVGQPGAAVVGELYELCPDRLLDELNGAADPGRITALLKHYRALRR